MGILEKISEIEKEIARTQKNKATEYHLGLLKAKLAKYRAQLLEPSKSASSKGEGFDVMKSGDARVALIGFPSVGKSTFLSLMTSTASEAASYEFTTLTCIPGVIEYKGANIQLLDLPGIIEGAAQGKGRGRQVIAVARTADVVIMMLDATKGEVQRSAGWGWGADSPVWGTPRCPRARAGPPGGSLARSPASFPRLGQLGPGQGAKKCGLALGPGAQPLPRAGREPRPEWQPRAGGRGTRRALGLCLQGPGGTVTQPLLGVRGGASCARQPLDGS